MLIRIDQVSHADLQISLPLNSLSVNCIGHPYHIQPLVRGRDITHTQQQFKTLLQLFYEFWMDQNAHLVILIWADTSLARFLLLMSILVIKYRCAWLGNNTFLGDKNCHYPLWQSLPWTPPLKNTPSIQIWQHPPLQIARVPHGNSTNTRTVLWIKAEAKQDDLRPGSSAGDATGGAISPYSHNLPWCRMRVASLQSIASSPWRWEPSMVATRETDLSNESRSGCNNPWWMVKPQENCVCSFDMSASSRSGHPCFAAPPVMHPRPSLAFSQRRCAKPSSQAALRRVQHSKSTSDWIARSCSPSPWPAARQSFEHPPAHAHRATNSWFFNMRTSPFSPSSWRWMLARGRPCKTTGTIAKWRVPGPSNTSSIRASMVPSLYCSVPAA